MTGEMHGPAYGGDPYGHGSGGPGRRPYTPPDIRTSAEDRDRAVDVLRAAYGDGRITRDELDTRVERAMAPGTYADLTRVISDLPGGNIFGGGPPPPVPVPAPYPRYYTGVRSQTNGLAVASLVTSLFGFFPIVPSAAAVVMGHVSQNQIRATDQPGSGVATAGLVLGYLGLVGWLCLFVAAALLGG